MPNEPQPLTEMYHKARRMYVFFAGLLGGWELVGLDLGKQPFSDYGLTIRNPEAAPFVILILLIYSAFRFYVEWAQNDRNRRKMSVVRTDFFLSNGIAAAAILIYLLQIILKVQVADLVSSHINIVVGLLFILSSTASVFLIRLLFYASLDGFSLKNKKFIIDFFVLLSIIIGITSFIMFFNGTYAVLWPIVLGAITPFALLIVGFTILFIFVIFNSSSSEEDFDDGDIEEGLKERILDMSGF